jgi:transposase
MKRLLTLTQEERDAISRRYKQEKNPRFRERLHCLLLKDRGHTNLEVAEMLLVVPETITDWLNLYQAGGLEALCRLQTGGGESFLTPPQIGQLQVELDKHVFQTAKQVCAWVQEQFGVTYSERGMRDLLRRLDYTHQKAHLVPAQADLEAQAAFLKGVRRSQDDTLPDRADHFWRCRSLLA